MANSVSEFWQLVEQSRLLAGQQCMQLHKEFASTNGSTDHNSPRALADWLVDQNIFSRYQVTVLLAGRPGPFVYGDYKIYDRVETGRLANEFRAVHSGTGHPVLLKFLAGPLVTDGRLWSAAATEAQIACSLSHPNLQRFFELVDLGSFKFVVEEDLHGETLAERLAAARMAPQEACRMARSLAQGLAAIHTSGRAHGDVRPLNVWLELPSAQHPGLVKLLRDPLTPPTAPNFSANDPHGQLLAQSDYLAPEFSVPGKIPDVLTDLYALGCTLYHMLAGHPPFPGGSAMQKIARHAGEAIRPLESYGVPQPLAQLVTFLMAKNPTLRYQDAQTVGEQLASFVDPQVIRLPVPAAAPTLPAFESAVRQSQARLATKSVQSSFGFTPKEPTAEPEVPVIRSVSPAPVATSSAGGIDVTIPTGSIPVGSIPTGKAVASGASEAGFALRNESSPAKITEKSSTPNDPALIAAKEARERKKLITILVSVGLAAVALIIGVNMMGKNADTEPKRTANNDAVDTEDPDDDVPELDNMIGVQSPITEDPPKKETPERNAPKTNDSPAESGPTYEVVSDDGKLPWASPTAGPPVDLTYVPPLGGLFLSVRPAEMLASAEGARALQALGPKFESIKNDWEKASGLNFGDCERLLISLHDNANAYPNVSIVAHLTNAITAEVLQPKWSGASEQKESDTTYYGNANWAYYLPVTENGKVLVMTAPEDIADVIKTPLAPRKRELEQVRRSTDSARHVTLLFDPTFLFSGEGDPLFAGDMLRAKQPLKWLLGEGVQAGALSLHFGDAFYAELRVQTKVDKPPQELANDFRNRMGQLPVDVKEYFVTQLNPPAYWNGFAFDFPAMLKKLHEFTRVGTEEKQAIVNVYLPASAGHNLVLGTELTLATAPGGSTVVATAPTATPKTLEDVLKLPMKDFSFTQTTFEDSIRDLENEVKELTKGTVDFSIIILGDDLQKKGITRNKSLANFSQQNKTVEEVVTALCMANNNIPGVKSPSEMNQVLVWAIAEDPADKKRKIFITTREGVMAHSYQLPAVFEAK